MRFDKWLKWLLVVGYPGILLSIFMPLLFLLPEFTNQQASTADSFIFNQILRFAFVGVLATPFVIGVFLEIAEIITSKKQGIEKLAWLAGLFFFTLPMPAIYYFLGRKELAE